MRMVLLLLLLVLLLLLLLLRIVNSVVRWLRRVVVVRWRVRGRIECRMRVAVAVVRECCTTAAAATVAGRRPERHVTAESVTLAGSYKSG